MEHVISLTLLAVGVGLLSWSTWELVQAFSSRRWPTAPGVIVVSDLQRSTDTDGGYMYRPEVSYRYVVNGTEFVAGRARFGDRISLSWSTPAVRIVRKYRAGAEVVVRYDPEDPSEAVLEPGVNALVWAGVVLGGAFVLFGLAQWW